MMTVTIYIISCLLLSFIPIILSDIYVFNNANKLVEDYDDQPANFGPAFPSGGIKGYVVFTNPKNACSQVASPPNISISQYRWIALIPRTKKNDTCDFDLKVLHAQNANFSAVIIYNYEDVLITMGPHGRNITIPSTLISLTDGKSIISDYIFNQTSNNSTPKFYIKITTEQIIKFGAYIIPFICIIALSFLGLVCFMIVKCYLHRRRTRRHRLPRSALKQLKIKKFVKGDRWEVCAICLDDYEDGAKLRILPCDHAYHMKCIDPWLLNNRRQCPVCKRYVFPNHDNSDEEESHNQTTSERTPLIQPSNDDHPVSDIISRNRQAERRMINPLNTGFSNFVYPINQSSEIESDDGDDDDDDDDDQESSSLPRQTTNHITTTDLVFDQRRSNSQPQLPYVVLVQSSPQENVNNDTTTTTMYESARDSPTASFTTPRAANFFVGSLGGTTDNTNLSARSIIEDPSDIETYDNEERVYSILTDDVEINQGYVPDEDVSTDILRTTL